MSARTRRVTNEQIKEALVKSKGINKYAAEMLGVGYNTIRRRLERYPKLREEVDEIIEQNLDYVEAKLLENIRKGHPGSIIFYLKTKGKHRGYVERAEVTGKDGGAVEINDMSDKSDEELKKIAGELLNDDRAGSNSKKPAD